MFAAVTFFGGITLAVLSGCGGDGLVDDQNPDTASASDTGWVCDTSYSVHVDEPSGLAWDAKRRALWTVSDHTGKISLIDLTGNTLKTLPWFGHDVEGIAYDESLGLLFVVDEVAGSITTLDTNGTVLNERFLTGVGEGGNAGLEGIACLPDSGKLLVLREDNPPTLFVVSPGGNISTLAYMRYAGDISGADYDPTTGRLWIISDQSKRVYWLRLDGSLVGAWKTGVGGGEGIVGVGDTLYIISDDHEVLYRFLYHPGGAAEL